MSQIFRKKLDYQDIEIWWHSGFIQNCHELEKKQVSITCWSVVNIYFCEMEESEEKYYLGFDFSTQQIKGVVIDEDLKVIAESNVSFDKDLKVKLKIKAIQIFDFHSLFV